LFKHKAFSIGDGAAKGSYDAGIRQRSSFTVKISGFLPAEVGVPGRGKPHESSRIPMVHSCAEQEE
jgi:hypothetical protein